MLNEKAKSKNSSIGIKGQSYSSGLGIFSYSDLTLLNEVEMKY